MLTRGRRPTVLVLGVVAAVVVVGLATALALRSRQRPAATPPLPQPPWLARYRSTAAAPPPNILLVVYDARRRDDFSLGPFGNRRADTPFLAELAERSLVFENAVSPGCWTVPVHAVMFSGLSVCQLGIDRYQPRFMSFKGPFLSLAEVLRSIGYRTISYADHPFFYNEDHAASLLRGFQLVNTIIDFKRYVSHTNIATEDQAYTKEERLKGMPPLPLDAVNDAVRRLSEGRWQSSAAEAVVDPKTGVLFPRLESMFAASDYFEKRYAREFDAQVFAHEPQPFFLFLNLHMNTVAKPDPALFERFWLEMLLLNASQRGRQLGAAAPGEDIYAALERNHRALGLPYAPFERPYVYVKQVFDNRFYDATFRAIWEYLDRRGLMQNTVTVVTSDHGMSFGEHGERLFLHDGARPYEYIVRVPLVIQFPESSALSRLHGRREERVSLADLFATILDVTVGADIFERELPIVGRSLVRRLERNEFEDVVASECAMLPVLDQAWPQVAGYARSVLRGRHKLIYAPDSYERRGAGVWPDDVALGEEWPRSTPRPEYARLQAPLTLLYDLVRDPHEQRDLASEERALVASLVGSGRADWSCRPVLGEGSPRMEWNQDTIETLRALGYVQ